MAAYTSNEQVFLMNSSGKTLLIVSGGIARYKDIEHAKRLEKYGIT